MDRCKIAAWLFSNTLGGIRAPDRTVEASLISRARTGIKADSVHLAPLRTVDLNLTLQHA